MRNELVMTFKNLILFSVLAVLLGVGLAYGLSYEFKHANSTKTLPTTATVEGVGYMTGFEFTIMLEKTEYSLGEPINITFAITNVSNQTMSVIFPTGNVNFDFLVYNNMNSTFYNNMNNLSYMRSILFSNTTVYWYQYGRIQLPLVASTSLNAGESLTESFVWGQTYRSELVPPEEDVAVSPGTYYIVGISETNTRLQTPPMQITISKTARPPLPKKLRPLHFQYQEKP